MPSGSKKRKASKKKKENQSVSNHSNGDDDVEQQDDKDGDVGELSSPNSHDHNSHQNNLLTEGDEEENEKGENISHTPAEEALKIKNSEEPSIAVEDDVVVPVDREFEIEDKSSKKADGSSSGSSSSSSSRHSSRTNSDDESHCIKKGEAAIDIAPAFELGSGDESLSGVSSENIVSEIDDGIDLVVENFPAEELNNISTLGNKVETDTSMAPYILEPMESEEKRLGFVEDNGISTVFMDVPLKRKDESIESFVTPDPKECVTQESHDNDRIVADIGVELEKDSGVTEVLLVHAPHPVQTTWKSCCGLFEVFARSGR